MSKVLQIKAELLTSAEAASRWPQAFEIEDDEIVGFIPYALDGESDFYDADPEHVIVVYKSGYPGTSFEDIAAIQAIDGSVSRYL